MYLDIAGMIMFQKQLRKEFTRTLRKATLLALLPLSLATASLASAQDVDGARSAPVPAEQTVTSSEQQPATQDTLLLEEGKTLTIDPTTEIKVESVEARYPYMKAMMDQLHEFNKGRDTDLLPQTMIRTATVRDAQQGVNITIVSAEGPLTCGVSQCYVGIYIDKGDGYKQAFAGSAPLPVRILKENNETSLYFCAPGDGRAQWTIKGDTLVHQGNVRSPQSGPSCSSN